MLRKLSHVIKGENHDIFLLHVFYRELINTSLPNGLTGEVSFNSIGDRKNAKYDILNKKAQASDMNPVGHFLDGHVSINDSIVWPGLQNTTPKGVFVSNHLRVSSFVCLKHARKH